MKKYSLLIALFLLVFEEGLSQSFYREREPKTIFYTLSLGAGTFFSAPRPSYDSLVNELMPAIQIGGGQRISDHFLFTGSMGFQPFSTKEWVGMDNNEESILEPVFDGFGYNVELLPTFSLLPSFHHMSRPILDLQAGIGLGYLFTYRTEKLFFNDKYYEFNLIEQGIYIPLKVSILAKIGLTTDVGIEGNFLYTFLDDNRSGFSTNKDSDHLGRLSLVYRKFFK